VVNKPFRIAAGLCSAVTLLAASAYAETRMPASAGTSPWGSSDEIGRLNVMSDASRLDALERVSSGKVYDLAVDLFVGMPDCCSEAFGDPTFQMWMTHVPTRGDADELVAHSSDAVSMSTHTGTHIDTLSHFGLNGRIWNDVAAADALKVHGWTRSGADKYPPVIAKGVLIDVAESKGVDHLPASYPITVADLQAALRKQRTALSPGDVVLVRTGLMDLWPDRSKLRLFDQPGLSLEATRWLAEEQNVMLLGADNLGLESFPSSVADNFAPAHTYLLAEQGVSFFEALWLEDLSNDRVYEFLFIASPLKIRGATGSPVRPIALPIRPIK
jgi:kynurenine formamidase